MVCGGAGGGSGCGGLSGGDGTGTGTMMISGGGAGRGGGVGLMRGVGLGGGSVRNHSSQMMAASRPIISRYSSGSIGVTLGVWVYWVLLTMR